MGEHLVLHVDEVITPKTGAQRIEGANSSGSEAAHCLARSGRCTSAVDSIIEKDDKEESSVGEVEEPLLQIVECRICQEDDHIKNLETPCACSGSIKYAHRACVQRWCNEKGGITCEICNEQYRAGYTVVSRVPPVESVINISTIMGHLTDNWQRFLLRAVSFLFPCYIMAWTISILQRRRERQVSPPLKYKCWSMLCGISRLGVISSGLTHM
ncbi:hypothetical protein B296_00058552 [Ensete ventricosum]|uniref:RING-CH-type domain-containing protein n=1 Tax=Ensete ventricosum TaxID=4639 RepID=A0A426XLN6_ENSVE|nr:hypothetical protein B296_00058552 [Ensete ventricosum]